MERCCDMKHLIVLGLLLVLLSAVSYLAHYAIFRDAHHIFIYLVGDIAFVPIEVLLVTLIIHRLLESREKRSILKKLNMVIGAFFSEVGTELLGYFSDFDPQSSEIRERLVVTNRWSKREFSMVGRSLEVCDCVIDGEKDSLGDLRGFLMDKRGFLLALLGNPNLLEHESFTDLLWAVFHLAEELGHRADVTLKSGLPLFILSGYADKSLRPKCITGSEVNPKNCFIRRSVILPAPGRVCLRSRRH
jgi:hypothetical protein